VWGIFPASWRSYLSYSLGSAQQIFIDGRSHLYEENGVYGDYLSPLAGREETKP
jgi:hypothetical protein